MDTDSIIYLTRKTDSYVPKLSDYLGGMTDELDGGTIDQFVSAGPKQYAFRRTKNGKKLNTTVKIRGFTLNSINQKRLLLHSMKRLVKEFLRSNNCEIVTYSNNIRRTREHQVVTKPERKRYRVVFDKLKVFPNGSTLPFGYSEDMQKTHSL